MNEINEHTLKNTLESTDNYLSDTHFLTYLHILQLNVEDFLIINITNYTLTLPKLHHFNSDIIVIPIRIISFDFKLHFIGHTNVVLYNQSTCTIFLFEPHGEEFMGHNPLNINISGIIHYYINELLHVKAILCKISGLQGC